MVAMTTTHPVRLLARERQHAALELRKAGATYKDIARQLNYSSPQAAFRAVKQLLEETKQESTTEFRKVQFERLNYMILKLWPRVQAGEDRAIAQVASLMAQQDRLMGTEAPVEHKISHEGAVLVIEGSEDDYVRSLEAMAVGAGAKPIEATAVEAISVPLEELEDGEDVVDAEIVEEQPCPRYVRPADPDRADAGMCARCSFTKDAH